MIRKYRNLVVVLAAIIAAFMGIVFAQPASADQLELNSNVKGYYAGGNLHWIGNMNMAVYYNQRVRPGSNPPIYETRPCCDPSGGGEITVWGSGYNGNGNIPARVRWAIKDIRYYNGQTGSLYAISTPQASLNGCAQTNWVDPHGNSAYPWGQHFYMVNYNGHGSLQNFNFQSNCWSTSDTASGGYYGWHVPATEHSLVAVSFLCFNIAGSGTSEPNCNNYPNTPVGTLAVSPYYQF